MNASSSERRPLHRHAGFPSYQSSSPSLPTGSSQGHDETDEKRPTGGYQYASDPYFWNHQQQGSGSVWGIEFPSTKKSRWRLATFSPLLLLVTCGCLLWALSTSVGVAVFGPTAAERSYLEAYYGEFVDFSSHNGAASLIWKRMRQEQGLADAARRDILDVPYDDTFYRYANDNEDDTITTIGDAVEGIVPASERSNANNKYLHDNNSAATNAVGNATLDLQSPFHRNLKHHPDDDKPKHHHHHHNDHEEDDNRDGSSTQNKHHHRQRAAPPPHDGCEVTVVLMRHCEKGTVTEHCAYQGYERSVYLASLFGSDAASRWPTPSLIFAEGPKRSHGHKMNFREDETVGPLAEKAHISVDDSYSSRRISKLTTKLLKSIHAGKTCGRVAVMVWKHSKIAHLARQLGCGPLQGCPLDYSGKSFDQVWQIKLVYRTWEHSIHSHEFVADPKPDKRRRRTAESTRTTPTASWKVFGSVQYEGFDPLAVSKQFGDYPPGGTASGGRWKQQELSYPERMDDADSDGWKETRVSLTSLQTTTTTTSDTTTPTTKESTYHDEK